MDGDQFGYNGWICKSAYSKIHYRIKTKEMTLEQAKKDLGVF